MVKDFQDKPRPRNLSFMQIALHLKCLDVDFEKTKMCCLCSLGSVSEITSDVEFTSPKVELHPDLLDVLKTRGLKIAHLNIRVWPRKFMN